MFQMWLDILQYHQRDRTDSYGILLEIKREIGIMSMNLKYGVDQPTELSAWYSAPNTECSKRIITSHVENNNKCSVIAFIDKN